MKKLNDIAEMTYERFGVLLFSGKIRVINFNYSERYTIVEDKNKNRFKVTYDIKKNKAIFEKVKE